MNIGDRIKRRRLNIGLTQEELAKKMGYKSKSTINKIETGINDISQSKIRKFSQALGVSIAYLMGWEDNLTWPEGSIKKFARLLIRMRVKQGLTQQQLSQETGIPENTIAMYESGKAEPSPESIKKLSELLGFDFSRIAERQNTEYTPSLTSLSNNALRLAIAYDRSGASDDPVLEALIDAIDKRIAETAHKDE